ncbi:MULTISPECIES: GreA/GreB family elongation factor [Sphingobium]|uniref:Transcription elongation factor GreB n=1 Tax=Sphingobium fuliginis (strain ATCC 27551) TaxID=336203 RepID=A0ABQ1F879_SPHSA|nr:MULTISPECIES: GreA/GreB family elongation factor [Sphingobium]AJR24005.1 nucleoside diphosphate kinase [Sphingobium sp. YBL2]RYL96427.1 nucleoside-diphosphate kinase [Sphingobium fuliginis]WDA36033.1 GreA/GreB family elongation factor [Sphingobium sp. YC-XJ3]GGA02428.1 transcription elongation factor GreB [Sphingobium fuliginis]
MSVAFRRESDEEHLEPTFEIPLPPGPNWVTARGLRLTREKVEALEAVDTEAMAEEDAKKLKRELRYWRTRLATAELRPVPDAEAVAFGSRVTYRLNGKEKRVAIVGDDEAEPTEGRIAFSAPLARAMMDAEEGESVDFGGKPGAIMILAIEAILEE